MSHMIIDPVCLIGISTYHQKKLPTNLGASYGILYALQNELTYHISMSAPLGTINDTPQQIVSRLIQYEGLRTKKSKHTVNYLDEFILIGWYVMGPEKALNNQKYNSVLNKEFSLRGGHYHLALDSTGNKAPRFYKDKNEEVYSAALQPFEKICSDSMQLQSSKQSSVLKKALSKQQEVITLYNQKLRRIFELLDKNQNGVTVQQKRQILEAIDTYSRLEHHSKHKLKTIQSINYSVLSGLILTKQNLKET